VHDLSFKRVPETAVPKLKWYLEGAVPRAIARADVILADSHATRADLIELFHVPPACAQTLYSGAEDFFQPVTNEQILAEVKKRYNLSSRFVLSVGTIEPRKNFARLIQAFAQLRRDDVTLVIAGGQGWLYDEIYAAPRKFGVSERVKFLGFVPDEDLPALYSLCEFFVYPSLYEGFGLPLVEAMQCGAAVITANNSSLVEAAGSAAILVNARDTAEIVAALARLLDDDAQRAELRARGFAQARRFSWDASARQLRDIFMQ
jgi:glycosyltransferase involved in cell wall biosynthesis